MAQTPFAFLWPMLAAMSATEATSQFVHEIARLAGADETTRPQVAPPRWATRNRVALALPSMLLRDFSAGAHGRPTLICAPYALHGATVADFAAGHSLVESLRKNGRRNLVVTDWRSATPQMRFNSIDTLLADLNVAVDALAQPVDLIGLCQGGWMALVYAARFPGKIRRLVLAGSPIDIEAGDSGLSQLARQTPTAMFTELLRVGEGRLLGQLMLDLWGPAPTETDAIRGVLQMAERPDPTEATRDASLYVRFRDWYAWTVDLPGVYYLEVVEWLYKENRLAEGAFVALGRPIELSAVKLPVALLAGRDDELVAPEQVLATKARIGSSDVLTRTAPCTHLGLFMGRRTLTEVWPEIIGWLDGRD